MHDESMTGDHWESKLQMEWKKYSTASTVNNIKAGELLERKLISKYDI